MPASVQELDSIVQEAVVNLSSKERKRVVDASGRTAIKDILQRHDISHRQVPWFRAGTIAYDAGVRLAESVGEVVSETSEDKHEQKLSSQLKGPRGLHSLHMPAKGDELNSLARFVRTAALPDHTIDYANLAATALVEEIVRIQGNQIKLGQSLEKVERKTRDGLEALCGIAALDDAVLGQILTRRFTQTSVNFSSLQTILRVAADIGAKQSEVLGKQTSPELQAQLTATTQKILRETADNLATAENARVTSLTLDRPSSEKRADAVRAMLVRRFHQYLGDHPESEVASELGHLAVETYFAKRIHHLGRVDTELSFQALAYDLFRLGHELTAAEVLLQAQKSRLVVLTNPASYYIDAGFDPKTARDLWHDHAKQIIDYNREWGYYDNPLQLIGNQAVRLQSLQGTLNVGHDAYRILTVAAAISPDQHDLDHSDTRLIKLVSVNTYSYQRDQAARRKGSIYLDFNDRVYLANTTFRGIDDLFLTTIDYSSKSLRDSPRREHSPRVHLESFLAGVRKQVPEQVIATRVCGWDRLDISSPKLDAIKVAVRGTELQAMVDNPGLLDERVSQFPNASVTLLFAAGVAFVSSSWVLDTIRLYLETGDRRHLDVVSSTLHPENLQATVDLVRKSQH